jgi:hypothetical protein
MTSQRPDPKHCPGDGCTGCVHCWAGDQAGPTEKRSRMGTDTDQPDKRTSIVEDLRAEVAEHRKSVSGIREETEGHPGWPAMRDLMVSYEGACNRLDALADRIEAEMVERSDIQCNICDEVLSLKEEANEYGLSIDPCRTCSVPKCDIVCKRCRCVLEVTENSPDLYVDGCDSCLVERPTQEQVEAKIQEYQFPAEAVGLWAIEAAQIPQFLADLGIVPKEDA